MNKIMKRFVAKVEKDVKARNVSTTLYCTECCTKFTLREDGRWENGQKTKIADVIQDRLIVCTCGTALGVYAQKDILPGEIVPIN